MACGTPVVTSTATSLPEAAGDAAILVDPHSTEEIAGARERILEDSDLRETLISKGLERAQAFKWQDVAFRVEAVLQQELGRFNAG